jgi:hypothetical protein
MDLVTHVNALPGLFEPTLLFLVVSYLFKAVALLTLLGGVYALLHRLLATPESSQSETEVEDSARISDWSKSESLLCREMNYHEA